MASGKTTYWMAAAVLALMMGNQLVEKFDASRLSPEIEVAAARLSGHATNLLARAEVAIGRSSTRFDRAQVAMATAETRLASVQASLARQEAICARVEAVHARMIVRERLGRVQIPVALSQPHLQMVIPAPVVTTNQDPI